MTTAMTAQRQERLPGLEPVIPVTLAEQFAAFHDENPWVYSTLERLVAERLATGATKIGVKALFEVLRWSHQVRGLNNSFTPLYARMLISRHPEWAAAFELRRRRTA